MPSLPLPALLIVHNGYIAGFESVRCELMLAVQPDLFNHVRGSTDSDLMQLNPLLLRRYRPVQILTAAIGIALVGGLALLSTAITGAGGLAGFLIPIAVILAS